MRKLLVNSTSLFLFICTIFSIYALEQGAKKKLKILISSPTIGWSHIQYQGRIADVLVEAGHEVHLLLFQMDPRHANYTGSKKAHKVISVARPQVTRDEIFDVRLMKNPFDGPTNMLFDGTFDDFTKLFASCCQEIVDNRDLISSLEAEKYDVALAEIYDSCIFGVFHKIGVKTKLGDYAVDLTNQLTAMYGIPSPSSYVTNIVAPAINGPQMTFFERVYNLYNNFYEDIYYRNPAVPLQDPMFKAAFGSNFPSLSEIQRNTSLIFVNTNEFYGLPRPISSKIVYIGGIVESKGKPLSKEVQNIFDKTQSGVVLVSFGTFADSKLIRAELRDSMLATFAKFPTYDFIWKFEPLENDTELFRRHSNVHTFGWTDQKTILSHPKIRAFITHCGLNSMNEATLAAVPTVGVPLLGDQPLNAAVMNHHRVGVYVDVTKVVPTKGAVVSEALQKVLQDPQYRENARLLQRKLLTQPFSPQEKLVKWVEFAAQFPDLNELNLPTDEDLGYLAYYSLDVLFVSIIVMATLLTVVAMFVKYISYLNSMSEIVPTQSVKQPDSPLADASGSEAKKLSRKQVEIPEDVWLVALKFLTGLQWSKVRFVSHQLNGLVQRNISHLPLVIIDEVLWSKPCDRRQISVKEWLFMRKLDVNMEQLLEILYHPALYIKVVSMQSSQQDIHYTFSVDDSRHIRCERFKLEYLPSRSHGFFADRYAEHNVNASDIYHYVSWMEQKVRAGQIDLHSTILQSIESPAYVTGGFSGGNDESSNLRYWEQRRKYTILQNDRVKALDIIFNFIFGSLRICASEVLTLSLPDVSIESDSVQFLNTLIAKFRTQTTIESGIPKVQIYPYPIYMRYREHLGPNMCENEDIPENVFLPCSRAVYVISNEQNRMRISFHKTTYYDPTPRGALFGFGGPNVNTNETQEQSSSPCYDVRVTFYTV
ncbi:UDP-glucoronosyl and UDP-glucosyl transferase domain-containing protein [Ditylenchus destructor]|nr:UDP-glucoronosyl and UDP-glucosyl transferase domain-containing protein [Ditylenchus destructor]